MNGRGLGFGAAAAALALAGCGGGGGGAPPVSTPPPAPTPSPTPTPTPQPPVPAPAPTPTPTPPPTSGFQTSEYNRSDGPAFHRVIPAWQTGATGRNVTIAVIDTGIDVDSPEFAGRISPASADVAGSRGIDGQDDHGNMVALIAAAARNNSGIVGLAYEATIQVLRADSPGSCSTQAPDDPDSGCSFSNSSIAAGVDRAVSAGARVINISLGGTTPNATLRNAVGRAATAGAVVIVSAGNEGESTDPAINPNNPDPFAIGIRQAGTGTVIIAGSVNENGRISAFSNRAGSEATWYLSALGERVCCVYENGSLRLTTNAQGQQFVTLVNGTSFAAPQIAGAAALLAQAFPNLSGQQIVDLLLRTARDAGAPGTDAIYGRGILDVANAFAPQGTTTLAGGTAALPLGDDTGVTGSAMGDAGTRGGIGAIVLDGYARAYAVDLAQAMRAAQVEQKLTPALASRVRRVALGNEAVTLAFNIDARGGPVSAGGEGGWSRQLRLGPQDAEAARVLAATVTARVAPGRQLGFAFRQGGDGLVAQLEGRREPAFLVAAAPGSELGLHPAERTALAYRHSLGAWGLSLFAERGEAATSPVRFAERVRSHGEREGVTRVGASLDRRLGAIDLGLGASWLREDRTVLGARLHDALGRGGADSAFGDVRLGWQLAPDWRLGTAARLGWTRPDRGGAISGGSLLSSAWAVDIEKVGVLGASDRLAFRVSQPLRVENGGVRLLLPVDYDYATLAPLYGQQTWSLAPHGREIMAELAWRGRLADGALAASLFYRREPGHFAKVADDQGVAVTWSREF